MHMKDQGGLKKIIDMLHHLDDVTQDRLLNDLAKRDSELAQKIREKLFIFEDLIMLSDSNMQRVIKEVDINDWHYALKKASKELKKKVFQNMSKRVVKLIQEDMEVMGKMSSTEVEKRRTNIMHKVRELEEKGVINRKETFV